MAAHIGGRGGLVAELRNPPIPESPVPTAHFPEGKARIPETRSPCLVDKDGCAPSSPNVYGPPSPPTTTPQTAPTFTMELTSIN